MKFKSLNLIYFSPTGSTKRIVETISNLFQEEVKYYDLTEMNCETQLEFRQEDLVLIGIPVYSGRVPKTAVSRFIALKGNNTPVALVAVYGNRDYDDALIELKTILEQKGFKVVAAAAFVTEHSVVRKIAKGRPNNQDFQIIKEFGEQLKTKMDQIEDIGKENLLVKGNTNYREYKMIPLRPQSDSNCIGCGICVKRCPVGAISNDQLKKADKTKCISCMRCIYVCPQRARNLLKIELCVAEKMISSKCEVERQPEIFI